MARRVCLDSRPLRRLATIFAGCMLLLVACGGAKKTASTVPNTVEATTQATTTPSVQGDAVAGKLVFTKYSCAGCHTLKAANATGNVGPDLDRAKPPLARIIDRVIRGGGSMPGFKGLLSDRQIADVAAFVFQSTRG